MKNFYRGLVLIPVISSFLVLSCEIEEPEPDKPDLRPASTPVINEVFTLPHDHQNVFWWIEFLNPTPDTVDLTGWTISLTTLRVKYFQILYGRLDTVVRLDTIKRYDTLGNQLSVVSQTDTLRLLSMGSLAEFYSYPPDTGVFDVPFAEGVYDPRMYDTPFRPVEKMVLSPSGLFTIVNNKGRVEDYTQWGEGDSRFRKEKSAREFPLQLGYFNPFGVLDLREIVSKGAFKGVVDSVDTLLPTRIDTRTTLPGVRVGYDTLRYFRISDSTYVVTLITIHDTIKTVTLRDTLGYWANAYAFILHPKQQLILKRPTGQIVDVVRIGPAGDPLFPDQDSISVLLSSRNQPISKPPEFESVARYVGGYFTGNTLNDFYHTNRPTRPPIPHGRSTVFKGR